MTTRYIVNADNDGKSHLIDMQVVGRVEIKAIGQSGLMGMWIGENHKQYLGLSLVKLEVKTSVTNRT